MVRTVKALLEKAEDPYRALLAYRSTPLSWYQWSPAELCMGRRLWTPVPQTNELLIPQWSYLKKFRDSNASYKEKILIVAMGLGSYQWYQMTVKSGSQVELDPNMDML